MKTISNRPPESGVPTTPLQLPGWLSGKEPACQYRRCKRCRFDPWIRKISWSRKWQPIPVVMPGKSQDRGAWWAAVHGVTRVRHDWVTEYRAHPRICPHRSRFWGATLVLLFVAKHYIYISLIHVPTDMKYERQEDANKESLYTLNDITNNSETFLPFSDSILLNLLKFCTYCLLDLIYTFLSHSSINNILFTFESFWM